MIEHFYGLNIIFFHPESSRNHLLAISNIIFSKMPFPSTLLLAFSIRLTVKSILAEVKGISEHCIPKIIPETSCDFSLNLPGISKLVSARSLPSKRLLLSQAWNRKLGLFYWRRSRMCKSSNLAPVVFYLAVFFCSMLEVILPPIIVRTLSKSPQPYTYHDSPVRVNSLKVGEQTV